MMMKTNKPIAFITGVTGQDGAHLADLLLSKGYYVYGGFRRGSDNKTWRLDYLGITSKIKLIEFQLNETQNIIDILQHIQPDEIYNLAAESFVADSFKYPSVTLEANVHGTINILESVRLFSPNSRMFFASSSEVFGRNSGSGLLNEDSPFQPNNPYAISKLSADYFIKLYREKYGLFACSGILFNHEGPLRGRQFVPRKITFNIARQKLKSGKAMELGSFDSARDWGSAVDYVDAMRLMLAMDEPHDFVIATGELSTVRDILKISALSAGFEPIFEGTGKNEICIDNRTGSKLAMVSEKYFRPYDTPPLAGDPARIKKETGWRRKKLFRQMIEEMVNVDIERWEKGIIYV
ncbi:MAG: GDP-mannose 4,6-dehydratase [gamma proteobacterium symbiont of Lucinoma myriamae]|nr:GDP-mannose 4,6-dehydratase [gamma proteobacterium symbiont of Lucinoma myriamae]MCU7819648.1 GDP-mannose 4,6-dehydratase [gamma proteobacterium symbiont of Lucinoma myriamae]